MFQRVGVAYGTLLDHMNKLDEAEDVYNSVMEVSPGAVVLGAFAVFLHRKRQNYDLAERYFKESLRQQPEQSSIHLKFAGFLRHVRQNDARADHHYIQAIETNPNNVDALGTYASYLHGIGDKASLEKAAKLYEESFRIDACHPNNCCNYGLFLSEVQGDYKRARELYEAALSVSSDHANTLYNYGVMLDSHLNDKSGAEAMYRRAIESSPHHPFALYNLAVIIEDYFVNAILPDASQESTDHAEAWRKEAEELYEHAVAVSPDDAVTLADHGRFLLCHTDKKKTEGEKRLNQALKIDPKCAVALYHLALLYTERKQFAPAEQNLRMLRKHHPQHLQGLRALIKVLQDDRYVRKVKKDMAPGSPKATEELMILYETTLLLARDTRDGVPPEDVMDYTSLAEKSGTSEQKLRAITFLEKNINAKKEVAKKLRKAVTEFGGDMDDEEDTEVLAL
jgi:tetratricopeptide (TPR) repeat protein